MPGVTTSSAEILPERVFSFNSTSTPVLRATGMSDTKTTPAHEIVVVDHNQQDLRRQCYDVRINVFVHEQGFPLDVELDQFVLRSYGLDPANLALDTTNSLLRLIFCSVFCRLWCLLGLSERRLPKTARTTNCPVWSS